MLGFLLRLVLGSLYSTGLAVLFLGALDFLFGRFLLLRFLLMLAIVVISHALLRRHLGQLIF